MSDVVFACVGENRPDWQPAIENVVLSVREFGGTLSRCPFVVHLIDGADPAFVARLEALDAEVRVVETVDARKRSANKLRMLELAGTREFGTLVMLDHDTVVVGDLADLVAGLGGAGSPRRPTIAALPAGVAALSTAEWREIYSAAGLPLPDTSVVTVRTGERTPPYYNSGVLLVPAEVCGSLHEHWARQLEWVLNGGAGSLTPAAVRKDQVPFSLALASAGIAVHELPVNANLSTTLAGVAPEYQNQWGPPFVLHYHSRVDEQGFLRPAPWPAVNPWIDQFNRRRAEVLGLPYGGIGRVSWRVRLAAARKARTARRG